MSKKFDKLLESATDSTLLEPNWDAIINCFDSVRSGEIPAKIALTSIRKRLSNDNPHVVLFALLVLDACVKNCGSKFHQEVATREFMEEFKNLGIDGKYENVKNKVLEMLQCWAMAFANKPEYKIIVDTHNLMKLAGFDFPPVKEADAMFMAQVAPEWQDGNECFRCRSSFGLLNRKHHCRACGQIFCDKCSQKEMALPQFGIEKEVRVCDACFEKALNNRKEGSGALKGKIDAAGKGKTTTINDVSKEEKEKALREKEEDELALALAISQSEAEAKEQERQRSLYSIYNGLDERKESNGPSVPTDNYGYGNDTSSLNSFAPSELGYRGAAPSTDSDGLGADDPLARYLNRDYWQNKKTSASAASAGGASTNSSQSKADDWTSIVGATAPLPSISSLNSYANTVVGSSSPTRDRDLDLTMVEQKMSNTGTATNPLPVIEPAPQLSEDVKQATEDTLHWCGELKEQVQVMENRIRSNTARGRPVVNDTAIQGLFMKLTELHAQVLSRMGKLDEDKTYFESLQDHIGHINEARGAVDALREEHNRKKAERLAEEQRQRQEQMRQTLEIMRMKKHTMLLEQREAALQRFQAQEMAARRPQPYVGYAGMPPQGLNSSNLPASYAQSQGQPQYGYAQQGQGYQGQQAQATSAQGSMPVSAGGQALGGHVASQPQQPQQPMQNIPGYGTPTQGIDGTYNLPVQSQQQVAMPSSGVQSSSPSSSLTGGQAVGQTHMQSQAPASYPTPTTMVYSTPSATITQTSTPERTPVPSSMPQSQVQQMGQMQHPQPQHMQTPYPYMQPPYGYMFPAGMPPMSYAPMPLGPNGMPYPGMPPHSYAQPTDPSAQHQQQAVQGQSHGAPAQPPAPPVVEEANLISFD